MIFPGEPWGLPLDETTLPQVLKSYNYSTHGVGKWHLGMHKWSYTPAHRGFDDFFGYYLGAHNYYSHVGYNGFDLRSDGWVKDEFKERLRYDVDGVYSTELYAEYVTNLLPKLAAQDNPFFIYMAFQNVHAPHMVPQRYIDKYSANFTNKGERIFAGMVGAVDEAIGNITSSLHHLGLDNNTLVIFSSDNGGNVNCVSEVTSSNYPYRGGKRSMYEGGVRVRTFVWGPGVVKSGVSNALMHVTDWLPTLSYVASLEGELEGGVETKPLDGVNQWDAIANLGVSAREEFIINIDRTSVVCGHVGPMAALRWRDYKLIIGDTGCAGGPPCGWYPTPNRRNISHHNVTTSVELYNIEEDPYETHDLAWDFQYVEVISTMIKKIMKYDASAVPPGNKKHDPASNPKHFNNTWMPWLREGAEERGGEYRLTQELWLAGNGLSKEDIAGDPDFNGFD